MVPDVLLSSCFPLWNWDTWKADLQEVMYIDTDLFSDMLYLYQHLFHRNTRKVGDEV